MLFKCKQKVFLVFFTFKLWQIWIKEGTLLKKSGLAKIDIILYSMCVCFPVDAGCDLRHIFCLWQFLTTIFISFSPNSVNVLPKTSFILGLGTRGHDFGPNLLPEEVFRGKKIITHSFVLDSDLFWLDADPNFYEKIHIGYR